LTAETAPTLEIAIARDSLDLSFIGFIGIEREWCVCASFIDQKLKWTGILLTV